MATTRVSSKGQVVLPKAIREQKAWPAGTVLQIEATADGVLLRPKIRVKETTLDEVAGCLRYKGPAKTIKEIEAGIGRAVRERHARR